MTELSSSEAKQSNQPGASSYDPVRGWLVLSAILGLLALYQLAFANRAVEPIKQLRFQVDINQASEAELLALPELGPLAAKRIVEYRTRNGNFAEVDELMRVPGIGPATLRTLRPMVTVGTSNRTALNRNSSNDIGQDR